MIAVDVDVVSFASKYALPPGDDPSQPPRPPTGTNQSTTPKIYCIEKWWKLYWVQSGGELPNEEHFVLGWTSRRRPSWPRTTFPALVSNLMYPVWFLHDTTHFSIRFNRILWKYSFIYSTNLLTSVHFDFSIGIEMEANLSTALPLQYRCFH